MIKDFNNLCAPAKLYFALAVLATILELIYRSSTILVIFIKLVFSFIWTFVLNWICSKGYKTISWVLVLLPYILLLLGMFSLVGVGMAEKNKNKK